MAPNKKRKIRTRNPGKDIEEEVERKINAREFLCEREFAKTSQFKFYTQAKAYGLSKLLGKRKEGNALFVRKYYLSAALYHSDVRLRDKQLCIGVHHIRDFYALPVVAAENCMFQKLKDAKEDFPYSQIASELVIDGEDAWFAPHNHERYLARADLTPEAKCWLHLVANNIYPTSHTTRLTKHMCLLIFLLKTKQPVRLEEIIYQAIETCSRNHSHKLIFPHLISELFLKAKVPQMDSDPKFQPLLPFNYAHVLSQKNPEIRNQMRDRRVKPPSPTTQQLYALDKKVDRVEGKLDKIYALLSKLAVSQGIPVDTPESSNTRMAATNLLQIGVGGEDVEINSADDDDTDHNAVGDDTGDGSGTEPVDVPSGSEYSPDEEDDY